MAKRGSAAIALSKSAIAPSMSPLRSFVVPLRLNSLAGSGVCAGAAEGVRMKRDSRSEIKNFIMTSIESGIKCEWSAPGGLIDKLYWGQSVFVKQKGEHK